MNNTEHKDIYKKLEGARKVRPSESFRTHFYSIIETETKKRAPSFSPFKLAFTGFALFIMAGTGLVAASQDSHPGSILYPVKEAVHKAKIVFSSDPIDKALLHLEKADENISDIEKSAADENKKDFEKSVEQYQENVEKARNESRRSNDSSAVEEELGRQAEKLSELERKVPTQAQTGLERALEVNQNREDNNGDVKGAENSINNSNNNSVESAGQNNRGGNNENRSNKNSDNL
jgi:hypothetical protein